VFEYPSSVLPHVRSTLAIFFLLRLSAHAGLEAGDQQPQMLEGPNSNSNVLVKVYGYHIGYYIGCQTRVFR
jgi:hypothetical protein